MRTLSGPGTAGIHRVNWDLKRQTKTTDADAARAGVTTICEREALDRVKPGTYTVIVTIGPTSVRNTLVVRKETDGVRVGSVRK